MLSCEYACETTEVTVYDLFDRTSLLPGCSGTVHTVGLHLQCNWTHKTPAGQQLCILGLSLSIPYPLVDLFFFPTTTIKKFLISGIQPTVAEYSIEEIYMLDTTTPFNFFLGSEVSGTVGGK